MSRRRTESAARPGFLTHPLLVACGVEHGFGERGAVAPRGLVRPRQVHGACVARLTPERDEPVGDADAIVSSVPAVPVAVVTADCVPVLASASDGTRVAAIHAGWRGLAAGVVSAAVEALARVGAVPATLAAAVGPHVGPCCYEVDAPVVDALAPRFGKGLDAALRPARPGHWRLDLGRLAQLALLDAGLGEDRIGGLAEACTACHPERFCSYRRDGPGAGRLLHFVAARRSEARRSLDREVPRV